MAINVLGVYTVPSSPDAHLVEVTVDRAPSGVDVGAFTQEDPNSDRANWQVPYDERYLDETGTREIGERWSMGWNPQPGVDEPATTRIVFFFHFLDPKRPFLTPDGEVTLPPPRSLPDRLAFVEYEPPD